MIFFRLLRKISDQRSFRIHPKIKDLIQSSEDHSSIFKEITCIIDEESSKQNLKFVREGIEYLSIVYNSNAKNLDPDLLSYFKKYGAWFDSLKKPEYSLFCFKSAFSLISESSNLDEKVNLASSLSNQLILIKNYKESEKILESLVKPSERLPNNYPKAFLFNTLGKTKTALNKREDALNFFQLSRQILNDLEPDSETQALLLSTLCHACTLRISTPDHLVYLSQAFELFEKMKKSQSLPTDQMIEFVDFFSLNVTFLDMDKFYEFVEKFEVFLQDCSEQVGLLFYDKIIKNSEKAKLKFIESLYEKNLRFSEERCKNNSKLLDRANFMIACKMSEIGEFEQVVKYGLKCLEIRKTSSSDEDVILVKNMIIEGLIESKNFFKAKLLLKEVEIKIGKVYDRRLINQHTMNKKRLKELQGA